MLKRFMFIGVLCFSMMALSQTQAWAWGFVTDSGTGNNTTATDFLWNTYTLIFEIKGGGSNDAMAGTFVGSTIEVTKATLVCSNPNNHDVTVGVGGITLVIDTPLNDLTTTPIDDRGRFLVTSEEIYAIRDEIPDEVAGTLELKQLYFNDFWMVDSSFCKNDQKKSDQKWDPYAYLIQSAIITGTIYTCSDPTDTSTCVPGDKTTLNCSTEEEPRYWGDDGEVTYTCSVTVTKK
jgi:hypothetical protein